VVGNLYHVVSWRRDGLNDYIYILGQYCTMRKFSKTPRNTARSAILKMVSWIPLCVSQELVHLVLVAGIVFFWSFPAQIFGTDADLIMFYRICPGRFVSDNTLFSIVCSTLHTFNITPGLDEKGEYIKLSANVSSGLLS